MTILEVHTIMDPSDACNVYNVSFKLRADEEFEIFQNGTDGSEARLHRGSLLGTYLVRFLREYEKLPEDQREDFCKKVEEENIQAEIRDRQYLKEAWEHLNKNKENHDNQRIVR